MEKTLGQGCARFRGAVDERLCRRLHGRDLLTVSDLRRTAESIDFAAGTR